MTLLSTTIALRACNHACMFVCSALHGFHLVVVDMQTEKSACCVRYLLYLYHGLDGENDRNRRKREKRATKEENR